MRATLYLLILLLGTRTGEGACPPLADADREGITQIHKTYVDAWLKGGAEEVMRLFSSDAVLIPHHGLPPVVGEKEIRNWWWPPDAPKTTINSFTMTLEQIGGSCGMAYVRGTQTLEWTAGTKTSRNRGNHLMLFRKESDGRWLITHQMWGDPAN